MYHFSPEAMAAGASELVRDLRAAVTPPPELTLSAWAEGRLVIPGETGSARPGPLSFDGFEYIREPLDRLGPDDPCRRVTFCGSAQIAKTTIGVIATLYYSAAAPRPWMVALPSIDEVGKYNREKWQPIVDATPELRRKIRPVTSRDDQGSTTTYKRFAGGKGTFVNAGSAKGLQMVSVMLLVMEETPNYETEVGGRGDPIGQLRKRQLGWELAGAKELHNSTPGIKGQCPVSADFEAGDQRRLYHPCAHCGGFLRLDYRRMRGLEPDAPGQPARPYFVCPHCSGRIEHRHKAELVRRGVWIATFPSSDLGNPAPDWFFPAAELGAWLARDTEARHPSYHAWQVVSPAVDWAFIAAEHQAAETGTTETKRVFSQQILGEPVEVSQAAVDVDTLLGRREQGLARGQAPEGAYLLTGAVDLNGDFASWAVWGWGPGLESWLVETGEIEGGPDDPKLWRTLAEVVSRVWPHAEGGSLPVEAWGLDSGYGTANVYGFCSRYSHVKALDGRDGWGLVPLRRGPVGRVQGPDGLLVACRLWTVGTWDLKRSLFEGLSATIEHAGAGVPSKLHLPAWTDRAWVEELTAEVLVQRQNAKTGVIEEERWKRVRRRNEALDLWVYCAALAKSRGVGVPGAEPDWVALRNRLAAGQTDLEAFWNRPAAPVAGTAAPAAAAPAASPGGGDARALQDSLAALYAQANGG